MDSRFTEGLGGPGRPPAAGGMAPRQPAPKVQQPQQPTVPTAPVGRPANAPQKATTPGPGASPTAAQTAAQAIQAGSAIQAGPWAQKAAQGGITGGAGGWQAAIQGASDSASALLSPEQQMRSAAAQGAPADAAKAAAMSHFEQLQAATQAATNPAATAGAGASSPAQAAASAGPTAAPPSIPADATSWSQTNYTAGGVGDPELDAALKAAVMEGLKKDPFSPEAIAAEQGRIKDAGVAGLGSELEAIDADAVRRGLGRTTAGAALGSEARQRAQASIADQTRQTMTEFKRLSAEQKQAAIGAAQALATDLANRGISLQQLALQRASMGGGGGGGNDNMIEIDNGDGTTSQVDIRLVDLMLNLGEGGMW